MVTNSEIDILNGISSKVSPQKDIFDAFYVMAARLIVGFIFLLNLVLIIGFPNKADLFKFFFYILDYKGNTNAYIFIAIASYLFGNLSAVLFDFLYDIVRALLIKLSVIKTLNIGSFFNRIMKAVVLVNPLAEISDSLHPLFKKHLNNRLGKLFDIDGSTGTTWELHRFSRHIGRKDKKSDFAKIDHYFDLFKGIIINLIFISFYLLSNKYNFLFIVDLLLISVVYFNIKNRTEDLLLEFIDKTYLFSLKLNKDDSQV